MLCFVWGVLLGTCLCFAHAKDSSRSERPSVPRALRKVNLVSTDFQSASKIKEEFDNFLSDLDTGSSGGKKSRAEESAPANVDDARKAVEATVGKFQALLAGNAAGA